MKKKLLLISFLAILAGCGSKTSKPVLTKEAVPNDSEISYTEEPPVYDTTEPAIDDMVCNAIADFLKGDKSAIRFTEKARQDLVESTWPEVQCTVEGLLDSPASFRDLAVKPVGPGKYKFECVCPDHGDKYTDCCTISASVAPDGKVQIEAVTWDDAVESLGALIDNATWYNTKYGFKAPDVMTPSSEIWVEDVPAHLYRWDYEEVCLAYWPLLGAWAVTDYPEPDSFLTESVHVRSVTYSSGDGSVFSGYTSDGRVWYMKKVLLRGGEVVHAKALVLIYPKSQQSDVEKLVGIVKVWK